MNPNVIFVVVLLYIVPAFLSYLAVKLFFMHLEKSIPRASLAFLSLALVSGFEYILYSISPLFRYGFIASVLVMVVLVAWTMLILTTISVQRKLRIFVPVLILLCPICWVEWNFIQYIKVNHKVAQAKRELRSVAVSLEKYYIDHDTYPPAVNLSGENIPFASNEKSVSSGFAPYFLTTPVAYLSVIPFDPFHGDNSVGWEKTYRYATDGKGAWILTSRGPDGEWGMNLADYFMVASSDITRFMFQYGGTEIQYDPTNGVFSPGDIFRTGP